MRAARRSRTAGWGYAALVSAALWLLAVWGVCLLWEARP
jgi:hypothetical protein